MAALNVMTGYELFKFEILSMRQIFVYNAIIINLRRLKNTNFLYLTKVGLQVNSN